MTKKSKDSVEKYVVKEDTAQETTIAELFSKYANTFGNMIAHAYKQGWDDRDKKSQGERESLESGHNLKNGMRIEMFRSDHDYEIVVSLSTEVSAIAYAEFREIEAIVMGRRRS